MSQARRLWRINSLKLHHREVLSEHAINTPAPCRVYMDKATQSALALKADIVFLKRQLAETEAELLERRAGRPASRTALPASITGRFVYTDKQWIVEQESKEERARIKKARISKTAAPTGPIPAHSVPPIPIWDDDVFGGQFGKAAGGEGDVSGAAELFRGTRYCSYRHAFGTG